MADRKISGLTALTAPASGDYVPIVDISESAAASKNKRITMAELFQFPNALNNLSFTQSGTGAVERTVDSKLKDVVSVKDFGAVGNGVTDDTTAFNNALASGNTVRVPTGVYTITGTLDFQNSDLIGEGWGSVIEGDIASASSPLIKAGRSVLIDNLLIRYKTSQITGSETQGQRVLIYTAGGPSGWPLQKGSQISNCRLESCGTAIYSPSSPETPVFSTTFDTLEIDQFSYKGFDLQSETRTGSIYSNIYIKSSYANVVAGFDLSGEESECVINQLNVEHTVCSEACVKISGARALAAGAIHIEGCDLSQADKSYVLFENSAGSIEALSVYYTRMSNDNTAVVKLGSTVYDDAGSQLDPSVMNYLRVGVLHLKGIAQPDATLYPAYPSGRRGLVGSSITGFNVFTRPVAFATRNIGVQVDHYVFNCVGSDQSVYLAYPVDPNSNIAFITKGVRFKNINGPWYTANQLMLGADTNNPHPLLIDRNANDYRPSFTWWFDDSTGLSHPAASVVGVTVNNADRYRFTDTAFIPSFNNQASCGSGTNRWTELFAINGTINTSDAREKQDIEPLDEAELRVAQSLKGLIRKFRFKHAVASKGVDARIHTGIIAQEVVSAFEAEGLDPFRYGLLCYDEWDELPEVCSEDGVVQQEHRPAGNMYGIRYEELLAFVLAAL